MIAVLRGFAAFALVAVGVLAIAMLAKVMIDTVSGRRWFKAGKERHCENVGYYVDRTRFKCSECSFNGWVKWSKDGKDRVPEYCPHCGAEVICDDRT